ncbi:MAG: calcium-binding protein [Thermoleophilaceae bacterium]
MSRRVTFFLALIALTMSITAVALAQTAGNDSLQGGDGNDLIAGLDGDDQIAGRGGDDRLDGGAGVDTISGGPGDDDIRGGNDRDFITGDAGNDSLDGESGSNIIDGGSGNDLIKGGDQVDSLNGGADDDRIFGGGGDDGISGASGRDHLFGGEGNDRIDGGLGQDLIEGGPGNDNIVSIDGQPDVVRCGPGRDVVRADGGDDVARDCEIVIRREGRFGKDPDTGQDPASDLSGLNTLAGTLEADTLQGGAAVDAIDGSIADDTLLGGDARDFMEGGPGADALDGQGGSNVINGAFGNDVITGGPDGDSLNGGADEDVIRGGGGDDGITGASGRDQLFGDAGDDRIEGGLGQDRIWGGDGDDNIVAADGQVDEIECGDGDDTVRADGDDKVDDDCELLIARVGDRYEEVPVEERRPAVGVGDSKADIFGTALFRDLGVRRARLVTPWDSIDTNPVALDQWLQNARNAGVEPFVTFNHGDGQSCLENEDCRAPSVSAYKAAMERFHAKYPWVEMVAPWNEANHQSQPIARNPRRAAQYYGAWLDVCRDCEIVALDVLDQNNMRDYVEDFLRFAEGRPRIFGLHNYDDVNREGTAGVRGLIGELEDGARRNRAARGFEVWLTETGGIVRFETSGGDVPFPKSESRAADRLRFMFSLASRFRERVRQVYVYNWRPNANDRFDSGILNADGTKRRSYDVLQSRSIYIR